MNDTDYYFDLIDQIKASKSNQSIETFCTAVIVAGNLYSNEWSSHNITFNNAWDDEYRLSSEEVEIHKSTCHTMFHLGWRAVIKRDNEIDFVLHDEYYQNS